jgi:serine/threonine protein kinase
MSLLKCVGKCKDGSPCKNKVNGGETLCRVHSPVRSPKKSPKKSPKNSPKKSPILKSPIINKGVSPSKNPLVRIQFRKSSTGMRMHKICLNGYNLEKYLTEGAFGSVYKSCNIDGDCNYVIKIQDLDDTERYDDWEKEVKVGKLFSHNGIGATFVGAWFCSDDKIGIIVTDLWSGQLVGCPPNHLIDKLDDQIRTIHKLGYIHGDILPKNILVKKDDNGDIVDATVTDFGSVDTPQGWKKLEKDIGWIETFYDYQNDNPETEHYYTDNSITLNQVVKDPAILDYSLIYYFKNFC